MEKAKKILITGPSGVGKTTLAQKLSEMYNIPFISGSYSDLVPETKTETQVDMMNKEASEIYQQDLQLIKHRNQSLHNQEAYITDRCYIDSIAYSMVKSSKDLPACDIEHLIELCRTLLLQQTDLIIYLPYVPSYIEAWPLEDNGKRITNPFLQLQVTAVIDLVLFRLFDVMQHPKEPVATLYIPKLKMHYGTDLLPETMYGKFPLMVLPFEGIEKRLKYIQDLDIIQQL